MLAEKIKVISNSLGWKFNQGSDVWQNLVDFPDDCENPFEEKQIYCLLLWNDDETIFNEFSTPTRIDFTGEFVLAVRSRIDDKDYNQKYDNHIKHLKKVLQSFYNQFGLCEDFNITRAKESEVVNVYDNNLDGVKVNYSINVEL
ncbi:hypothetical protein [Empedobacter brevis]|uniref:hypothetical protein n=1 Tax=Empedobacter brevis TaxID=247 RepID=UPI00289897E5|nr:hypothetical protein [Empedobacter brevis]